MSGRPTLDDLRAAVDVLDLARAATARPPVVVVLSRAEALELLVLLAEVDGSLADVVERLEAALDLVEPR
jgi:hypothetical protein